MQLLLPLILMGPKNAVVLTWCVTALKQCQSYWVKISNWLKSVPKSIKRRVVLHKILSIADL